MIHELCSEASVRRPAADSISGWARWFSLLVGATLAAALVSCGKPKSGESEPPKAPVVQELPEFFGVYVNNKGKLIHLDKSMPQRSVTGLAPDVSLLMFAQGAGSSDLRLVRLAELSSNNSDVKLFAKPLEKPGMLMFVPAEPLPVGAYTVAARGILPEGVIIGVGSEKGIEAAKVEAREAAVRGLKTLKDFDGKVWTNSLGMKFAPVAPTGVAFCIWETRVRDYVAFAAATSADDSWRDPGFPQTPDHPVVRVSWEDAKAFCKWLTDKERAGGLIGPDMAYRLPNDEEWSIAVGLPPESGRTPQEKDKKIDNVFPWGTQWPPPRGAGNYGVPGVDEFDQTSPVGSFAANNLGIHDLGGNVWEWCEDSYSPGESMRVLRGGSWIGLDDRDFLLSSYRLILMPVHRDFIYGFRCVLVVSGGKALWPGKGRRDARRGKKPCRVGAKKEPNPDGFPPEKTDPWVERARSGAQGAGDPRG